MRKVTLIICFLVALTFRLFSQEINVNKDTVVWESNSFNDQISNVSSDAKCHFEIFADQHIDWVQENGEVVIRFSILKMTSDLNEMSQVNEVKYEIKLGGSYGKIMIRYGKSLATLTLELRDLETGDIVNEYLISGFHKM